MGLFSDISEFFTGGNETAANNALNSTQSSLGDLSTKGQQVADVGGKNVATATDALNRSAGAAENLAAGYNKGAQQSMGANAADYMQRANAAAEGQAAQSALAGSTAAARQQLMAARAAGLNKGQASLRAGQAAGDQYTNQYQAGLESGRNQYGQAANQFGQMGAQQQGLALQGRQAVGNLGAQQQGMGLQTAQSALASKAGVNQNQQQNASQSSAGGGGFLGGIISGIGSIFSDEQLKDNIQPSNIDSLIAKVKKDPLEDLVAKVRPVDFNYKPESGEDPTKDRVGILAQDLEKTSMADNVIDTPEGKVVDAGQQTLSNTNLIVQLAQRLLAAEDELRQIKGAK